GYDGAEERRQSKGRGVTMGMEVVTGDEVRRALAAGRAVVALESTLIAQGLPWPENLETARASEAAVREAGAVPATAAWLGGVHRGAAESFDVSNDLDELARADGALVVCSGVKSILDVAATLEALETRGVPVVGYQTDEFPAFTTRSSGLPLEARADTPAEA